jgi:hypothetical protein
VYKRPFIALNRASEICSATYNSELVGTNDKNSLLLSFDVNISKFEVMDSIVLNGVYYIWQSDKVTWFSTNYTSSSSGLLK